MDDPTDTTGTSGAAPQNGHGPGTEVEPESWADLPATMAGSAQLERGTAVGRFIIIGKLGSGGMGVVYAAYDTELDRRVAIKFMRPRGAGPGQTETARARFIREAQGMAKLSHPNVVSLYDVGRFHDEIFLAMELVDGDDLAAWLKAKPRSWRDIIAAFVAAGRGLAAAHEKGLVHRDFKPENVLVDNSGRVCVGDFGLVRGVGKDEHEAAGNNANVSGDKADGAGNEPKGSGDAWEITADGAVLGTLQYMAPEQYEAGPVDARTDQFSFCVALYEALYRENPIPGANFAERRQALREGRIRPAKKDSRVPLWLRSAVVRGMAVDPEKRYAGMDALLAALSRDPDKQRRRMFVAAALMIVVAGSTALSYRLAVGSEQRDLCRGAERKWHGVWDKAARARMQSAFAATGLAYANDEAQAVASGLDRYARDWTNMHIETCEATRRYGDQSAEIMQLRMDCLDARLREAGELVALFGDADAAMVRRSVEATQSLPALEICADVDVLEARMPLPASSDTRAEVARIRAGLATVWALAAAGKYEQSVAAAEPLVGDARKTEYQPIIAEALLRLGRGKLRAGDADAAEDIVFEATWFAEASRHDVVAARTWLALVEIVVKQNRALERGVAWGKRASAAVERIGRPAWALARLHATLGAVAYWQGDAKKTLEHNREALAVAGALGPGNELALARAFTGMGVAEQQLGNLDQAEAHHRRALELRRSALGPRHPDVGASLINLGIVLGTKGDYQAALAVQQEALELHIESLGPTHPRVAKSWFNVGNELHALDRLDEARDAYQKAVEIYGDNKAFAASTLANIALILRRQGKFQDALDSQLRALDALRAHYGEEHPTTANALINLGETYMALDRQREGIARIEQGLAIIERVHGPDSLHTAHAHSALGKALLEAGRAARALPSLERALGIMEQKTQDVATIAGTRFALGRALWATSKHERARATITRARSEYAGLGSAEKDAVADIDAWLASHR